MSAENDNAFENVEENENNAVGSLAAALKQTGLNGSPPEGPPPEDAAGFAAPAAAAAAAAAAPAVTTDASGKKSLSVAQAKLQADRKETLRLMTEMYSARFGTDKKAPKAKAYDAAGLTTLRLKEGNAAFRAKVEEKMDLNAKGPRPKTAKAAANKPAANKPAANGSKTKKVGAAAKAAAAAEAAAKAAANAATKAAKLREAAEKAAANEARKAEEARAKAAAKAAADAAKAAAKAVSAAKPAKEASPHTAALAPLFNKGRIPPTFLAAYKTLKASNSHLKNLSAEDFKKICEICQSGHKKRNTKKKAAGNKDNAAGSAAAAAGDA